MKNIKVSVIVPVYNTQPYLKECLDSLVNQTLREIEVIVINDGSTDDSLSILREYADKYPNLISLLNISHSGVSIARNKGLEIATGEYISFVDSDDYLDLKALETIYSTCKNAKADIGRVNHLLIKNNKQKIDYSWLPIKENCIIMPEKTPSYLVREAPGLCNKTFKHELVKNLTFPERKKWEDVSFVFPATVTASSISYIHQPLYCYRQTKTHASHQQISRINSKVLDIFDVLDLSDQRIKEANKWNCYEQEIQSFNMLHSLYRVCDTVLWPMKLKDKLEIASYLLKMIEVKYGKWQNNEYIRQYCKDCLPWGISLSFYEAMKKDITTTDNQKLTEGVQYILNNYNNK